MLLTLVPPQRAAAVDGSGAVVATVPAGGNPTAAAVIESTGRVYVASQASPPSAPGTLTVIDGVSDTVVTTLTVGANPSDIVTDGTNLYVVNSSGDSVSVVSAATNSIIRTIAVTNPRKAALDPGRSRLYVTGGAGVTAFDTGTFAIVATRSMPAYGIAVDPVTNRLYVGNLDLSGSITVLSAADVALAVLTTIPVGGQPNNMVVDSAAGRVYAASSDGAPLSVISVASNSVVATIPLAATASASEGLSLDTGRKRLYVAHESASKLAVIDTATNVVLGQITVGTFPQDAAVNTVTDRVYVPNFSSASVSVVGTGQPDLVVTSVTVPASVARGSTLTYSWTVRNQGTGRAEASAFSWSDQAWISTSPTSIAGAYAAGGIVAPHSLDSGAWYDRTFSATVSTTIPPGNYWFIIQTDSNSQVGESNESNNLSAGVPITVTEAAPAPTPTPTPPPGPTITDARLSSSAGVPGTSDANDTVRLTFSRAMDANVAGDVVRVTDADGGIYDITCGPLVSYNDRLDAACSWSADGLVLTLRMQGNSVPAVGAPGDEAVVEGSVPGLQWPATIASTTGITDAAGVAVDVAGSADRLIDVPALPRIAYIYGSDTAARDSWSAFLASEGFAVDAITVAAAATADLSPYVAILISDDSGSLSSWGTPAAVSNIAGAGKRTVGLGEGGYAYFGRKYAGASNTIGWGNGAHGTGATAVTVMDAADPAWQTPNALGVATGSTVALYGAGSAYVGIYDPNADKGLRYIGRHSTDPGYHTVIGQGSCDVLWGFSASAASLTSAGKQLFENLLGPCAAALVSITAEVREDLDRDGAFDAGEPYLTSPKLEVFRIGAGGERTLVGSAVGSPNLTVSGIEGGTFDVVETDPVGYVSTSPNTVRITVGGGSRSVTFLDARNGVTGTARHRETPDGTTFIDVTLAGATVTLIPPTGAKQRLTAGADGAYAFPSLSPGTAYTIGYDGAAGGRRYVAGVRFTTDGAGNAYVPAPVAVYNRKNHTWLTPVTLGDGTAVVDQVWRRGQATWYRFAIAPQQHVTIQVTGCAFNCDLVIYRDLEQVRARLRAAAQTQAGVRQSAQGDIMADDLDADDLDADDLDADDLDADDLDADDLDADDLDADDLDADDLDADDLDADDLDADDLDADDLDADDLDADDLDADDLDADDLDADDLDADDLDADGDGLTGYGPTYVAAQRKGLRAASLTPGLAPESVTINTRDLTGYLYVRVAGGSSLSGTFTVTARRTADLSCTGAPLVPSSPSTTFGAAAVGKRSLVLTDTAAYGLAGPARDAFLATLGTFASHATVQGLVVDLAADANIQTLRAGWQSKPTCVAQANLVTDAIREVVQRFRTATGGSFEYLINVGGDSVIPFRRVADWAEISRESRYNPPVQGASEASLVGENFLNDDFYVSSAVDGPNRTLYLPDAAVGRLVESVADVQAYIAMYLAANGVAEPTTALSSGYDFNLDLASYVTNELTARGLAVDSTLVSNTWTSADWRAKVLGGLPTNAFGILSLQGHFSANRLVPADNGQRVLSTELAAVTDGRFLRALVYSLGCHSGYSIVNADGTLLTQPDAFPEVFVRQGATLVAGTGYQYGETILMKNTEALIALLTDELGYRTPAGGSAYATDAQGRPYVPIGRALAQAKRAYMAQTATPRGIDLKVVGVSTVYGSPTMAFRLPSSRQRPAPSALTPAGVSGFTGLTALDVASNDTLTPVASTAGTYYTAAGNTTTAPYRPIAPLSTLDANVPGSVLQGAVFLGGNYSESAFTPRLSIPATEQTGEAPRYANDVFMPVIPVRTNLFDGDAVQVVPFQYRSNADGTAGTARVFGSGVQVRAFWSSQTGIAAAADAPVIRDVSVRVVGGQLNVLATVRGLTTPGIAEVWLTYTDTTAAARSFASVRMTPAQDALGNVLPDDPDPAGQGFTRIYAATLAGDPAAYRFLVQAVGGNGRVSAATNNGRLFGLPPAPPSGTPPTPPVRTASAIALTVPATAAYRSAITVSATLTSAGAALAGRTVAFSLGGSTRRALTDATGTATVALDVNVTPRAQAYALTAAYTGDANTLPAGASRDLTVVRAPTTLEPLAGAPQYSDGASVARLRANGLTLNEQPVVITRDGVSVATVTDFNGDVRFDTMDFASGAGAGTATLTVEYPGNDRYAPSSLTLTSEVRQENGTLVLTQLGPQPTGSVTFTTIAAQVADGSLGDIRRATVTVEVVLDGSTTPSTYVLPVDSTGASTLTVTLAPGLYQVTARLSGDFTSDPAGMTLPVYDANASVTGGGWVIAGSDSTGVPLGGKTTFGFVAKYAKDGVTATGNLKVHVKSAKGKDDDTDDEAKANGSVKLKATTFDWLVIAGQGAAFTGTGTVNGVAGYRFRVDVVDDGDDLFVIHIWDAAGSYASPTYSVRGTLGGGNIKLHR